MCETIQYWIAISLAAYVFTSLGCAWLIGRNYPDDDFFGGSKKG